MENQGYNPYGKLVKNLQKGQGLNTSLKDKYFGNENPNEASEDSGTPVNKEAERLRQKQRKLQK